MASRYQIKINDQVSGVRWLIFKPRSSFVLRSQVHPRGLPPLQEAVPGGRPAVGRRPRPVAELQRQRGLRVAQTLRRFAQGPEGHEPEDVLHQQEPHHARPGEQVRRGRGGDDVWSQKG